MPRQLTFALMACLVLGAASEKSYAVTVSASATVQLDGLAPINQSSSDNLSANERIENEIIDSNGNLDVRSVAHGASNSNGKLSAFASYFGVADPDVLNNSATATWSETFNATAGSSAQFDFFIPEAGIGFEANGTRGLTGGWEVLIELNGVEVFSSRAEVTTVGFRFDNSPVAPRHVPFAVDADGSELDPTPTFNGDLAPTFGLNGAGWLFDPFSGSLDLAPQEGENILSYMLRAYVFGSTGEAAAVAFIGDPLSLTQSGGDPLIPGSLLTLGDGPVPPVPVPAAVWLFATGVIGILGLRRRKTI